MGFSFVQNSMSLNGQNAYIIIIIIVLFVQKTKDAAMQTKNIDVEQDTQGSQPQTSSYGGL